MYIPKHFREDDMTKLHAFIQAQSFGALVTQQESGVPLATHLPFILDPERGPYGTLLGHFALGNPQWRTIDEVHEVLVIFQGPHAYITPSWYETTASVPTWNFAAVHAYGVPRILRDEAEVHQLLLAQVKAYEAGFEQPWSYELPNDYIEKLARGIVAFELPLSRLEGKFKLSQNRSTSEQERVIEGLGEHEATREVARLMKERQR